MNEIELIITTTEDGIFVTKTEAENGNYTRDGFINRRFDKVILTIQTLENAKSEFKEKDET